MFYSAAILPGTAELRAPSPVDALPAVETVVRRVSEVEEVVAVVAADFALDACCG